MVGGESRTFFRREVESDFVFVGGMEDLTLIADNAQGLDVFTGFDLRQYLIHLGGVSKPHCAVNAGENTLYENVCIPFRNIREYLFLVSVVMPSRDGNYSDHYDRDQSDNF